MTIYMSSGAFRTRKLKEVIAEATRLGISHLELSSGLVHEPDLEGALHKGIEAGLTLLLHNYFPAPREPRVLNLTASDEDGVRWSLDHCRRAIDLSVLVDANFYSLHSGYAAALKAHQLGKPAEQADSLKNTAIDREGAYQLMVRSVREVADYAAARGKSLLLENNVISPLYLAKSSTNPLLMTSADEIERFMTDIERPNVGFLIDTGHVKVSATALAFDPHDFLDRVTPYVRALHLSDNNGQEDQNLPFDTNAWFYPQLKEFCHVPWVIEAYTLEDNVMFEQIELLQDIKNNT